MQNTQHSFTDLTPEQLNQFIKSLGEPAYRVKQLGKWVYQNLALSYDEMTDLPLALRQKLSSELKLHSLEPVQSVTAKDGTIKFLFKLADGNTIESALMPYETDRGGKRYTLCVSTQVGCAVGCPFCATGQQGFVRNLTSGEIIDQALYFARYLKEKGGSNGNHADEKPEHISNVVFMGMGEPLANYDNLWQAIEMLNSADGFGLGARNMVISTAGLVPQIKRLAKEKLQVGLAVSLHASDDNLRNKLVPLNRKYPLDQLIAACREYTRVKGRRLSFEYILFHGINDSLKQAQTLAYLVKGLKCHINLIPANLTDDATFRPSTRRVILAFEDELKRHHLNVTLRDSRGQDINAGCGQLRSRFLKGDKKTGKSGKTGIAYVS